MSLGVWQLALILMIVFVLFGAGKLPRVMGEIGKGVKHLRDGMKHDADTTNSSKKYTEKDTSA